MFEVIRRNPIESPARTLLSWITHDPFFNGGGVDWNEEGTLPLDISEKDGEVLVRASLPGFQKNEVDVQVHQGVLTITAEHTEELETKDEKFYRKERRYGAVSRRVALPGVVDSGKANAELKDGVLTVRIPQSEAARPRQISIK
jgi:HSP20 family protein